ncbi:MAG: hypothetical protein E3J56_07670 [Candidatus Aminicenantes bacterium]|nr:MAG: hypothetical protein E3J56_07670 [Candidatus Aminicenantes bacterium]
MVEFTSNSVFAGSEKILIVGVSCSPRKGKTTATAVEAALDAAKGVNSQIDTELFDLGGMSISGLFQPRGETEATDDFVKILPTLRSPNLGGIIIGSPVYFRIMSSLCNVFIERLDANHFIIAATVLMIAFIYALQQNRRNFYLIISTIAIASAAGVLILIKLPWIDFLTRISYTIFDSALIIAVIVAIVLSLGNLLSLKMESS